MGKKLGVERMERRMVGTPVRINLLRDPPPPSLKRVRDLVGPRNQNPQGASPHQPH
jgi:hypothetical protein